MDKIHIKDLFLRCIIGVSDEERREKVDVVINIVLLVDLREVGKSDLMEDTVNYRDLKKRIIVMVEHSKYYLIETLAERIASLCLESSKVQEVQVLFEKPGALRFARSVGVEIIRKREDIKMKKVFISIASNINPEENILDSVELLKRHFKIISVSCFYKTFPIGNPEDPFFINGIIEIETTQCALSLKNFILRPIESALGRVRTVDKNAARTIDLDILVYGDEVIKQDDMIVPDPQIKERDFLAVALAELAPQKILSGWKQSLGEYCQTIKKINIIPLDDFSLLLKREIKRYSIGPDHQLCTIEELEERKTEVLPQAFMLENDELC